MIVSLQNENQLYVHGTKFHFLLSILSYNIQIHAQSLYSTYSLHSNLNNPNQYPNQCCIYGRIHKNQSDGG